MPTPTPDQGLSLPVGPDIADNPAAFTNFVAGVEPRLTRLYTDTADRTARQLVVAENELSGLATENRVEVYNGTNNISLHTRSVYAATRMSASQVLTASSTVLQNVTAMASTLIVSSVFEFYLRIFYEASTAADIKFAFTIPAGANMRWGINAIGPGGVNPIYTAITGSGTATPVGGLGVGSVMMAIIQGEVSMGVTGGALQLQAAQNTADASVTTVFDRSYMEVWRLS